MTLRQEPYLALAPQQISVRAGDRLPGLVGDIIDNRGQPVDLTGATVDLWLRRKLGQPQFDDYRWVGPFNSLILDAAAGKFYYDVQPDSTLVPPGDLELVADVTFADGTKLVAPTVVPVTVTIRDQLVAPVEEGFLLVGIDGPGDLILSDQNDNEFVVQLPGFNTLGEYEPVI